MHAHVLCAGLDVNRDHILEMACIVTDKELNVIAEVHIQTPNTSVK